MSALSEQCEVLRLWAKHLREGEPILASDLREAADTILNLRDMAQQAQSEKAALERRIDELCAEVERLRVLARWASMLLTGIMPYVDYSRCTALEAVAAWKVEASELGIEVD